MRIVGMLRVQNEARWIARVLRSIEPVCEHIVILDDHSEDATATIAERPGAIVIPSPFAGLDEARDKNYLLGLVEATDPDWVLHIDGDEELAAGGPDAIRAAVSSPGDANTFSMRVRYLWNREDQERVDGVYGNFRRPSLFRLRPGLRFGGTGSGGNFHCGNAPGPDVRSADCAAQLLHYGYLKSADRIRKYDWYNARDAGNIVEDGYRHMVVGDVFSASSKFRWGGPLELRPLS